jgi:hypothetical protein
MDQFRIKTGLCGNGRENFSPVSVNTETGSHKYGNGRNKIENRTGQNRIFSVRFQHYTCGSWLRVKHYSYSDGRINNNPIYDSPYARGKGYMGILEMVLGIIYNINNQNHSFSETNQTHSHGRKSLKEVTRVICQMPRWRLHATFSVPGTRYPVPGTRMMARLSVLVDDSICVSTMSSGNQKFVTCPSQTGCCSSEKETRAHRHNLSPQMLKEASV